MGDFPYMEYVWPALAALSVLWGIWTYNRFILLRRLVDEAWSGIAVQLKRRHDLIPNLVETVKGYTAHERGLLEEVTRLRGEATAGMRAASEPLGSRASAALRGRAELAGLESSLGGALGRLLLHVENYPALRANENFIALQHSLADTEEHLQMARRYYNGTVRDYIIALESFPSLLIGKLFSFPHAAFFELENRAEGLAPEVSL